MFQQQKTRALLCYSEYYSKYLGIQFACKLSGVMPVSEVTGLEWGFNGKDWIGVSSWITVGSVWADVFSPISKCLKLFTERAVILGKHKLFSKWSGQKDVLLLFFPSLSSITTLFMSFYALSIHNYLNAFLNASFLGRVRHSHFGLLFNYSFFKDTVQLSSLWIKTESEHNAFFIIKLNIYV